MKRSNEVFSGQYIYTRQVERKNENGYIVKEDIIENPVTFLYEETTMENVKSRYQTIMPNFDMETGSVVIITTSDLDFVAKKGQIILYQSTNKSRIVDVKKIPVQNVFGAMRGQKITYEKVITLT